MTHAQTIAYYEHNGVLYHLKQDGETFYFTATTPDLSRSICKAMCGDSTREGAIQRLRRELGL